MSDSKARPTALIADDEPELRELLATHLNAIGIDSQGAGTGLEAIEVFERTAPDLVLLDIRMLGIDGFEVCRRIRERPGGNRTAILIITALSDDDAIDAAYDAGATDFIIKPIHWGLFRHRVRSLLHVKRLEEDTRRLHDYFTQAIDLFPGSFVVYNEKGHLLLKNRETVESLTDAFPSGQIEVDHKTILRQLASSGEIDLEGQSIDQWVEHRLAKLGTGEWWVTRHTDGQCYRVYSQRLKDGGILVVRLDLTEISKNEAALREAKEEAGRTRDRLARVIECFPGTVAIFDADRRLVMKNNTFARVLKEYMGDEAADVTRDEIMRVSAESGNVDFEGLGKEEWLRRQTATFGDGEWTEFRLKSGRTYRRISQPLDDGGAIDVLHNITEMKEREDALRESKEEASRAHDILARAIDCFPAIVILFDKTGHIVLRNERSREMAPIDSIEDETSLTHADLGRQIVDRVDLEGMSREQWLKRHAEAFANNEWWEMTTLNGTTYRKISQRLPDGGAIGILLDITPLKEREKALRIAKEEAEAANQMKTKFLAGMSHELRTPLNAIIGFSDIIRNEMLGPLETSAYVEYAEDINKSGLFLLDTLTMILEVSRIESGKLTLQENDIEIGEVIARVVNRYASIAKEKGAIITREGSVASLVHGDENKLCRALACLVDNAVKFTPSGGHIRIGADQDISGAVRLWVSDDGIGMAPEDIPAALSLFAQVDGTHSRQFSGMGLGLAYARSLIDVHGGSIHIDSDVDSGTTVTLTLPRSRVVAAEISMHPHG